MGKGDAPSGGKADGESLCLMSTADRMRICCVNVEARVWVTSCGWDRREGGWCWRDKQGVRAWADYWMRSHPLVIR